MDSVKWLIGVAVALTLIAVGTGVGVWNWVLQPKGPEDAPTVIFEVPAGASGAKVARLLEEEGLLSSQWQWRLHTKWAAAPGPKAGRHPVSARMNVAELRGALADNPIPEDVTFTVVEGWRIVDTDRALAEAGLVPAGAYVAAAQRTDRGLPFPIASGSLEGYLFPETYRLPADFGPDALIDRQLEAFVNRFYVPHKQDIEASPRTLDDLVKMASLLEREEPDPSLRPMVAGVLYKRLDANTPLGVDATSRYRLDQWNDRRAFLRKLRDPTDPYNTRLKTGLPPTALGAPSLDSLRAALNPVDSPYWYYLHDAQRQIHFARSAAEHEANRKRYNVY